MNQFSVSPFASDECATLTAHSGRQVAVRPIIPSDDTLLVDLYERLSPRTRQLRFFCHNRLEAIVQREATRLASVDPVRHAALIGLVEEEGIERAIGVARLMVDPAEDGVAEFAIVLRDDFQHDGIGRQLLRLLINAALRRGVTTLRVVWMAENHGVQRLIQHSQLPARSTTHQGETTTLLTLPNQPYKLSSPELNS